MPPNSLVHVIDDDEAVRDSLAFLLRTAQTRRCAPTIRATAFLTALPAAQPAASSPTCACRR